ncbi:kinase-like domain-containing protein [Flammula alnicola]|nr:kinase-like domain-containing protein [Flammula alnicola]
MHSRDHGSLNGRPRHQESLRPSYHHLTYKRSVEDYFLGINGPPSRLLPTPSPSKPIQKSKTVGPSIARALNPSHPDAIQHSEGTEKKLKSRSQSSKHTFRWMKGELIGSGSHGRVFIALNVTTGELMAVKQVELPRTASDRMKNDLQNFVETLRDERDTLKDLDHANIVQYLGFEENPETVNIFLQYVSGGTIDNCLREYGKFQEGVTKSFTRQILEGLSYLHANGILHRDLKSANILVEPSGICKISDFGISKRLVEVDRTYSVMKGTSYWMAPEAIFNEGAGYDSKVDIWSVGCILLEMWTAKRPWYDEPDFLPVIFKLLRDKLPPPLPEDLGLSESAEHFRRGCFHPDPAQRSSADMLLTHPYLILPETWSFPGICDIGYRAATNSSPAIEIAQIAEVLSHSLDMNVTDSFQRSSSPALTMNSGTLATISTQINPPRTISPPLESFSYI